MEIALVWLGVGALVGFVAASKRGYSPFVGVVVGALLGILSPVLLVFAGTNPQSKKCPDCAEFVKADAKVCKHCGCKLEQLKIAA